MSGECALCRGEHGVCSEGCGGGSSPWHGSGWRVSSKRSSLKVPEPLGGLEQAGGFILEGSPDGTQQAFLSGTVSNPAWDLRVYSLLCPTYYI